MNFLNRLTSRFTARGRSLTKVNKGRVCAKNREPDNAIEYYTDVINSSEAPGDVKAMALFNRALALTTIGRESRASVDLNAILSMTEAIAKIKKSARDKLVRMQRKLERETSSSGDA